PTYAHRQRRRSAGALHPEGARSPGTSSTSSMGAVPGSTPDEPILVPPGNTPGWRAPARRRMHTDNAGVAPVRYTPGEHAPWERRAPARWAQSPAAPRTSQCSSLRGYLGSASTRSPTYAHRQRRRSAGALHPEGARSLGTSSTSSMGAVPGSTADEPVLIPPGIPRVGEHPLADVCSQTPPADPPCATLPATPLPANVEH